MLSPEIVELELNIIKMSLHMWTKNKKIIFNSGRRYLGSSTSSLAYAEHDFKHRTPIAFEFCPQNAVL